MFFLKQPKKQRNEYEKYLKIAGSLSNLFSESETPALYYRVAEKVFCKAFEADDLSRSDVSVDARKKTLGIGLKTFLAGNNKTLQKVAEFNNDRHLYSNLDAKELVEKISELRNARIEFTQNVYNIDSSIYHCVLRASGKFLLFEELMRKIDIPNIKNIKKEKEKSIKFEDGKNEYSFNLSKSTLMKRFVTDSIVFSFDVDILEYPLEELEKMSSKGEFLEAKDVKVKDTIFLPLYGTSDGKVHPKSGLNQWNAGGRKRDLGEVYIPIPAKIRQNFPIFFPDKDTPFVLKLPNGKEMRSKICQEGGKALMSYSNKELGQWILRDVLKLEEGEIFTDEKMQLIGVDSVRIDKIDSLLFEISFSETGSYEDFKESFNE